VPAAPVLQVLAWTVVPMALSVTLAQVLFSADRQSVDLGVNVVGTLVSVTACAVLIPRFGALGAAAAVVLSSTTYAVLEYVGVCAFVGVSGVGRDLARLGMVTVASVAALEVFAGMGPLVATVVGLGVYGAGVVAAGMLERQEIQRVLRVIRSGAMRAEGRPVL